MLRALLAPFLAISLTGFPQIDGIQVEEIKNLW
jgi:hypothetical protein